MQEPTEILHSLQYDLVTIVLHEVCHGLGFFDSMDTDNSIGWYGIGSCTADL